MSKIEVMPGKFIKYEIPQELVEELAKIGIDAHQEIELACMDFARYIEGEKNNAPTEN